MNPDAARALLAQLEGRVLPDAAGELLERLQQGLANPFEDWRIAVWGPLGVDGGPPMVSLANLAESLRVYARPVAATAMVLTLWHQASAGDGISGQAARIAQAVILNQANNRDDELAKLADQATADRLARAWIRHVRAFLASADLEPTRRNVRWPPPITGPADAWWKVAHRVGTWLLYSNIPDIRIRIGHPEDMSAWLDERGTDSPASTEDGVPWLSARLADYLRRELGDAGRGLAEQWLERERERERTRTADDLPYPALPPHPALPGWTNAINLPGLGPGWGVSAAAMNLGIAIWREEIRPAMERSHKLTPALPFRLHEAIVGASGNRVAVLADGAELVDSGLRWAPDPRTGRGLPADVLDGWLRDGFRYRLAGWRVFDLVMHELQDWIDSEPTSAGSVPVTPRLLIPRGKSLAARLGMPQNGTKAAEADEAVNVWASLVVNLGEIQGRVWTVEEQKNAPGRPGAWIVTPGEVLLPGYVHRLRDRALVPWPDRLPDCAWIGPNRQADALEAGLALPMLWRKAAGAAHGESWKKRPGVRLADHWSNHGRGLEMERALDAWGEKGWIQRSDDLVAPGPALPKLTRFLDDSAEHAEHQHRAAARGSRRR